MTNDGIINIHGKDYMTVAKRVELAHKDGVDCIETEVLQHSPVVVIKATVTVKGKKYTGISSANPAKAIEKTNPYEVAETSAVGRALGFANYGIVEGIASADEMVKASITVEPEPQESKEFCSIHNKPMKERQGKNGGHWFDHRWQDDNQVWQKCNGKPKEDWDGVIPETEYN